MSDHHDDDANLVGSADREIRKGLLAIGVFVFGFGGWAAFAPLDAAVVAPGMVVVSGSRQAVQHRDGGVVSALHVREGDRVDQGQILIELGAPEIVAQYQAQLSQVLDLHMQRARLTAELSGVGELVRPAEWASLRPEDAPLADAAFERHRREVEASGEQVWSQFDAQILGYRQELVANTDQEALLQEELSGMRELAAEQLVPLTRVRALERSLADLSARRAQLNAALASTQQARSAQLREVDASLAELTPQVASAREQLELTRLRAPVSGTVVGLTIHTVGGVVRPGERLMDVVPDEQALVIEARARPEDADNLIVGQRAEVKITAFNGRNLPIVYGEVETVSADRFIEERTGAAYFLVNVSVPAEAARSLAEDESGRRRLRAGLPAQIVVATRKRTALQYMLEPLNATLWRSFREE
jgi:HlyD family type I secretion membrane fusion protein